MLAPYNFESILPQISIAQALKTESLFGKLNDEADHGKLHNHQGEAKDQRRSGRLLDHRMQKEEAHRLESRWLGRGRLGDGHFERGRIDQRDSQVRWQCFQRGEFVDWSNCDYKTVC